MKMTVRIVALLALAAGLILLLLASCGSAYADDHGPRDRSPSGAFNPSLSDSPVIVCVVKDACRFETGPKK